MSKGSDISTIHGLVCACAEGHPGSVFLSGAGGTAMTRAGLHDIVRRFPPLLRACGAGRSDRVALVVRDPSRLAVSFLGVAAHAVAAPLNPDASAEEIAASLADLSPAAVVTDDAARVEAIVNDRFPCRVIPWEEVLRTAPADEGLPSSRSAAGDTALILHTSGTTGASKKVPLTHAQLLRSARNVARSLSLDPADRCLAFMPFFHIHGLVACLLAPLVSGGSVVPLAASSAALFPEMLASTGATWYSAVPTVHRAVLDACGERPAALQPGRLRFVRSASAPLPAALREELQLRLGIPVIEAYGMTEAAHLIASNPLGEGRQRHGSVGVPFGVELSVVDAAGHPLPCGETGEVVVRGDSLMDGYLGVEAAMQPWLPGGWMRTGDLGILDAEGYLYLKGRVKEIINKGGEKISPREIDEVLLSLPGIAQAVAFGFSHPRLGEEVAAAVVLHPDARHTEEDLRRMLAGRLSAFKIPARILIVASIPRTASGKLQRLRMAEWLADRLARSEGAPENPAEETVVRIMAEVLGLGDAPGRTENFFALGGDSLQAVRIVARLSASFGVALPAATFLRYPTAASLAPQLLAATGTAGILKPALPPTENTEPATLQSPEHG